MRELGEQWAVEIDGEKHMVKAVSVGLGNCCTACDFEGQDEICKGGFDRLCIDANECVLKDLGILNFEGSLPCKSCGQYPVILFDHHRYWISHDCVGNDCGDMHIDVGRTARLTKQEVVEIWNRRK